MADNSKIEWTDATWNPITGCTVVSPGCTNTTGIMADLDRPFTDDEQIRVDALLKAASQKDAT